MHIILLAFVIDVDRVRRNKGRTKATHVVLLCVLVQLSDCPTHGVLTYICEYHTAEALLYQGHAASDRRQSPAKSST